MRGLEALLLSLRRPAFGGYREHQKKTKRPDRKIGAPRLLLQGEETYGFASVPGCVFALCFLR